MESITQLYPADGEHIGRSLIKLRNKYSNVFVVAHSRQMFASFDHVIGLGPQIVMHGSEDTFV